MMKPSVKKIVFWVGGVIGVLVLVLVVGIAKLELANEQSDFRQLVGRDASVQQVDENGVTDLHIAAANGWAKLTKWLIANGANVNAQLKADKKVVSDTTKKRLRVSDEWKRDGESPIYFAVRSTAVDVAKVLLANGSDVNAKRGSGWTPLHSAALNNDIAVVKFLLANGADVHATNNFGSTPLHIVVSFSNAVDAAKLLLTNGAYVNAIDNYGYTPLDKAKTSAIDYGSYKMVNLLRQHGGQCNANC